MNLAGYNTGCEMAALTVARKEGKDRDQRWWGISSADLGTRSACPTISFLLHFPPSEDVLEMDQVCDASF